VKLITIWAYVQVNGRCQNTIQYGRLSSIKPQGAVTGGAFTSWRDLSTGLGWIKGSWLGTEVFRTLAHSIYSSPWSWSWSLSVSLAKMSLTKIPITSMFGISTLCLPHGARVHSLLP